MTHNQLYLNLRNKDPYLTQRFDFEDYSEDEAWSAFNYIDIGEFDFVDTIGLENFIHSLTMRQTLIVVLRAMGYSHRETKELSGIKTIGGYYVEATTLRNKFIQYKEQQED